MAKLYPQTGPVTDAGKETSSSNATTHGGTSEKLIVAGERREDFDALLNDLLEEHSPQTSEARNLVEDAALARWFLWRRQRVYSAVESAVHAAQPSPDQWLPETYHKLALLDRYKAAAERSFKRILQNLASLSRARKQEAQSKLAIARSTVALDELEREQWKTACRRFDRPTLIQGVLVSLKDGAAVTKLSPSNAALLHETRRTIHPPEQVCRVFDFEDGVPPEYYAFTGAEHHGSKKRHIVEHISPVSVWSATVAQEQKLATLHVLPGPDHFVS
jgi:hypothetical protein